MNPSNLTDAEMQVIGRFIEAGVGDSAEKLAQLSGTGWKILSSSVREVSYVSILSMFQQDTAAHFASHLRSRSMLPLEVLILFPDKSIRAVADAVADTSSPRLKDIPNRLQVISGEISNILGQGIILTMVNALKISVILTTPKLLEGRKADMVGQALANFDNKTSTLILSRVEMHSDKLNAECSIILIVDTAVIRQMLKKAELA